MLNRKTLRLIATNFILLSAIFFLSSQSAFAQNACDNFPVTNCNVPSSFQTYFLQDPFYTNTSLQTGEPSNFGSIRTLWYSWTAPRTAMYVVNTRTTNPSNTLILDTAVSVFRGGNTFASLIPVGSNNNWDNTSTCFGSSISDAIRGTEHINSSCMIIPITSGTKYYFQVGTPGNSLGTFTLNVLPVSPTAATSSISGRITTTSGRAVSRTIISLTDSNGNTRTAITNPFGYYRFDEVETGQNYVLQAQRKGYQFQNNPRVLNVNEDLTSEDFIGENPFTKRE